MGLGCLPAPKCISAYISEHKHDQNNTHYLHLGVSKIPSSSKQKVIVTPILHTKKQNI